MERQPIQFYQRWSIVGNFWCCTATDGTYIVEGSYLAPHDESLDKATWDTFVVSSTAMIDALYYEEPDTTDW